MYIDSHAHIYLPKFKQDREEIMQRSIAAGVTVICMPNIDLSSVGDLFTLADSYPEHCFPMVGLHPCSVQNDYREQLDKLENLLDSRSSIAVGEIGLDFYWDKSFIQEQKDALITQINWAKARDLPIVLHVRDAMDETIDLVEKYQDGKLKGVFHCFTGNQEQASRILQLGFYVGIGGIVTFKNGGLDTVVPGLPLERILLETDSPYLAPSPHRGKRNEPANIPIIAEKIAALQQISVEEVAEITSRNTRVLFNNLENS